MLKVRKRDGRLVELDLNKIHAHSELACKGLDGVNQSELETSANIGFYDGMPTSDIQKILVLTAADKIKDHYNWTYVAARLLLLSLYKDVTGGELKYPSLQAYISKAVAAGELSAELLSTSFDFDKLNSAIKPELDYNFTYLGLTTLSDRYFRRDAAGYYGVRDALLELPQHFYMRVAMGLTLRGAEKAEDMTDRAIQFYEVLSNFEFHNSTPTLFNAGTSAPQLSSCYLLSMGDSLSGIMGTATEAASYSKLSGGIGIDMTHVRGRDSFIHGTAGRSSGVIPFAKIVEATLGGFNQMGKRKGAGAIYLADWHCDIEAFLELKNETGDPRMRTPDLQTALWTSELFLRRKDDPEAIWSLFSPDDVPELTYLYGEDFEAAYVAAEEAGKARATILAADLWKKMITAKFETGSFYMCNKDMINRRNMQKGSGVIRSSNLCTEITLNTEPNDISAVCNIGSINVAKVRSKERLRHVVRTAIRMLDNVVTIGLIPHDNGRKFQNRERAIGLGIMGETELLAIKGIYFDSDIHLQTTAQLLKDISFYAIEASADLAEERGAYALFHQSEWAKGQLPYDTAPQAALDLIPGFAWKYEEEEYLRAKVRKGMRNSNVMAIAPTATIANIVGTEAATELPTELVAVKGNLSGDFVNLTPLLNHISEEHAQTARDINQWWVIAAAAVRQVYIDQAQSTNMWLPVGMQYADGTKVKGSVVSDWYSFAMKVLKTTYYLHGVNAGAKKTEVERKVIDAVACSIDNPEACESCQ